MPIEEFVSTDHQERDGDTTPDERRRRDEKLSVWRRDESRAPRRRRLCRSAAMISSRHAHPRQPRLPRLPTSSPTLRRWIWRWRSLRGRRTMTPSHEEQVAKPRPRTRTRTRTRTRGRDGRAVFNIWRELAVDVRARGEKGRRGAPQMSQRRRCHRDERSTPSIILPLPHQFFYLFDFKVDKEFVGVVGMGLKIQTARPLCPAVMITSLVNLCSALCRCFTFRFQSREKEFVGVGGFSHYRRNRCPLLLAAALPGCEGSQGNSNWAVVNPFQQHPTPNSKITLLFHLPYLPYLPQIPWIPSFHYNFITLKNTNIEGSLGSSN